MLGCSILVAAFLQAQALRSYTPAGSKLPWAAGCKLLFLDIGSNVGVQVRKLYEPEKYPEAKILGTFTRMFGEPSVRRQGSNTSGLCAIGFEANPSLVPRLRAIEDSYLQQGWRVKFVAPRIVSDTDNHTIDFWVDRTHSESSSVTKFKPKFKTRRGDHIKLVQVRTLDLTGFIEEEVLPAQPSVVMAKMDIEGSEFIVLPKMLKKGLLCQETIAEIDIEWHERKRPPGASDQETITQAVETRGCGHGKPTPLLSLDDETYLRDGRPLPGSTHLLSIERATAPNLADTPALYAEAQRIWGLEHN